MKKLYSILLTFVLSFSIGSVAFAEAPDPPTWVPPEITADISSIEMPKWYGPTGGPTTSFTFNIVDVGVTDYGDGVNPSDIPTPTFAADDDPLEFSVDTTDTLKYVTINLPTYTNVGIYTYKITETNDGIEWVEYDTREMFLKVTVIRINGVLVRIPVFRFGSQIAPKGGQFENDYLAGSLTLNKTVTGNLGELDKYFKFTVTFTPQTDTNVDSDITISATSYSVGDPPVGNPTSVTIGSASKEVTIWLKHGETVTFSNIPYGVTYTISEDVPTGYSLSPAPTYEDDIGEDNKIDSALETVVFTNNRNTEVDTGISLDSLPYILLLGFAVLGMGVLFFRKRQNANF